MRLSMRVTSSVRDGRPAEIADEAACDCVLHLRASATENSGKQRGDEPGTDDEIRRDFHPCALPSSLSMR